MSTVSAGIPTLADDYIDQTMDLNKDLVKHPQSTFLVITSGESMINAGIQSGDILVGLALQNLCSDAKLKKHL